MIIDFHTHLFPPEMREKRTEYIAMDPHFAHLYGGPKARMATAEDIIASMDHDGVDVSVALSFGFNKAELCKSTNDYILDAIHRFPDRLVGFCTVQPNEGQAAVEELRRCAEGGMRGLGEIMPDGQDFDLADEHLVGPLMEVVREYRMIVLVHSSEPVGHSYPGKGETTPKRLYRFIQKNPGVPIVCAHFGGGLPFYGLMPEVSSALSNTYFDTAAAPYLYRRSIYRQAAEIMGMDKLLFGSDYPLLGQGRCARHVQHAGLPRDLVERILGRNGARLLGMEGA
ncbi:MAG: amidohydrolase [Chloroflexota bacterium]|nr:MAG: amidohydrolase [Chloroflexota bacterium]